LKKFIMMLHCNSHSESDGPPPASPNSNSKPPGHPRQDASPSPSPSPSPRLTATGRLGSAARRTAPLTSTCTGMTTRRVALATQQITKQRRTHPQGPCHPVYYTCTQACRQTTEDGHKEQNTDHSHQVVTPTQSHTDTGTVPEAPHTTKDTQQKTHTTHTTHTPPHTHTHAHTRA